MSFNVLANEFIDFKNIKNTDYVNIDFKLLVNRLPRIFSTIDKYSADIILLQEITPETYKIFKNRYDKYHTKISYHKTSIAMKNPYGNMTLIKKELTKKLSYKTLECPTGIVFGITKCKIHNTNIMIINAHLDHNSSETKRIIEINKLFKYIDLNNNIIIGGDFNTNKPVIHDKFSKWKTFKSNVGSYLDDLFRIDWIYLNKLKLISGKILGTKHKKDTSFKYGSDHYPSLAKVEL
jgi:endonuclease/exonuclease/phosphatase family metal-dependent hydrolase